jgi:hypothetical protein
MKISIFFSLIIILFMMISCTESQHNSTIDGHVINRALFGNDDRITPYTQNPRYWQYKGEPVLLLGASDQDNLFNHPGIWPFGLESHLDLMVQNGGNYVRNTMSSRDHGNLWAFGRTENGLYDLNTWKEEYWQRFEHFLNLTLERDIIVQIEIWDRFDYARAPWQLNPFNPKNNINYTSMESRLPETIDTHPGQRENPFFRTPPGFEDNPDILQFQLAFIDKMLSISLQYPHILYCISNETNESPLWSDYWAEYILRKAAEKNVTVHVTEMWDAWDLSDSEHDATFNNPGLYTFVDISQNTHQRGQTHWDNAQYVRNERLADGTRPINNVKIYGGTHHGHSFEEGTHKLWRNIFGGLATSRFHRSSSYFNPSGIGLLPLAQIQLKSLRMFTDQMDVFSAEPSNHLLSNREENEAYAFAEPGYQYAVYFPSGGSVRLDLSDGSGPFSLRWLDIMNSEWHNEIMIDETALLELTAPAEGPWAVLILYP